MGPSASVRARATSARCSSVRVKSKVCLLACIHAGAGKPAPVCRADLRWLDSDGRAVEQSIAGERLDALVGNQAVEVDARMLARDPQLRAGRIVAPAMRQ